MVQEGTMGVAIGAPRVFVKMLQWVFAVGGQLVYPN